MIGPNSAADARGAAALDRRTARAMTPMVIGITICLKPGSSTSRPSTALSTEMAGVISASQKKNAVPSERQRDGDLGPGAAGDQAALRQREQRQDAALTVVVGAHDERRCT